MKAAACKAFDLEPDEVQCWDYLQCSIQGDAALDAEEESDTAATVNSCKILDKQDILLIEKVCSCYSFALVQLCFPATKAPIRNCPAGGQDC